MAKQGASELKDLDVDRVDAVDKPATGRNFLLFKSEGGAAAIMKGYGAVATAAHIVLQKMRTDKNAVVSRKSAIALNGLAQILGEDAVFVGKSVPTQPYQFTEPDADKRGPADEDLGGNFTPRSMPGSMVGSVQFRMKDDEEDDSKGKAKGAKKDENYDDDDAKGKAKGAKVKDESDDDDEDKKRKAAAAKARKDEDDMDASEKANRGVARSIDKMAEAIAEMAKSQAAVPQAIVKALIDGPEQKGDVRKSADEKPRSRQVTEDDAPVRVRKSGGYEPRFGVSFADVAFPSGK